jgi:hypothetical protein
MSSKKKIFFHVGTGKTGTTFLQYRAFPKFKGVHYIQRTSYRKAPEIIRSTELDTVFISWEMDQQLDHETKLFGAQFPDTQPIIVFRRHDSYLASQYRRFVKNGFKGEVNEFFDLNGDNGFFKQSDFHYQSMLDILRKNFSKEPIVLLYDDLKKDPNRFITAFAEIVNATVDLDSIDFSKKHTSYNEKQLKVIKSMGKYVNLKKRRVFENGALHLLWKIYFGAIRYSILYGAKLIPNGLTPKAPLMDPTYLDRVKDYFSEDWEAIKSIARKL